MDIYVRMEFRRADGTFLWQQFIGAGETEKVDFEHPVIDGKEGLLGFTYIPKVAPLKPTTRKAKRRR